jgi:tetratricopeptide (TPR) repeat protein
MIPYLRLQQGIVALRARDAEFAISRFRLGIDATRGPESQDAPIVACFHILLAVAEAFRNAGESVQVHVSAVRRIAEQLQDPGRGFLLAVADFIAGLFAAAQRGDKTQAIQLINTACDSMYRRIPPQMPFREFLPHISALVLKEQKKYSEAEEAIQAVIVKVKTSPFTNAVMPLMLKELADVQKARGHFLDAINTHRRSLETYRENGQAESAAAATVHLTIGLLQMRLRQIGPMLESLAHVTQ